MIIQNEHPALAISNWDSLYDPNNINSVSTSLRGTKSILSQYGFHRTDGNRASQITDAMNGIERTAVWERNDNLFASEESAQGILSSNQRRKNDIIDAVMDAFFDLNDHLRHLDRRNNAAEAALLPPDVEEEVMNASDAAEAALLPSDVEEEVVNASDAAEAALLPPDVEEEVMNASDESTAAAAFPPPLPEPDAPHHEPRADEGGEDEPEDIPPNVWAQFDDHGGKIGSS